MSRTPSSRAKKTPSAQGSASKSPLKTPKDKTPSKRLNPLGAADTNAEEGSPTPKGRTKRFADSLEAVSRATPKRTRGNTALPSFDDDVFGSASPGGGSPMSREAFRANERLKRQREARNFVFEGDANAPRQTRSGRVVETISHDYGEDATDESAEEQEEVVVVEEPVPQPITHAARPLLPQARNRIVDVLATLNGRLTEPEDSEALTGLVALLSGTVLRGEGNSCLVTGPRGSGKTRIVEAALRRLPAKSAPIVVHLSGLAQTDDRRAIREMGRQIALAEGQAEAAEDDDEMPDDYAPTTLPAHLLALLTAASDRAIIIVVDEFDLFTEHARQALLYCLLDVVQSVQAGQGRGIAVVGVTSRVDTLLLLEKRVKSRFSHRVWRVESPLARMPNPTLEGEEEDKEEPSWRPVLMKALVPWLDSDEVAPKKQTAQEQDFTAWKEDWEFAVGMLLENEEVVAALDRLSNLTTDVRLLFRPFVSPICGILASRADFLAVPEILSSIRNQVEQSGWSLGGTQRRVPPPTPSSAASSVRNTPSSSAPMTPGTPRTPSTANYGIPATPSKNAPMGAGSSGALAKLRSLPHPALTVLIIAKHMLYTGRPEFTFAQMHAEYEKFARVRLVGVGRTRWTVDVMRLAWQQCIRLGLLQPAGPQGQSARFNKMRSALAAFEIVAFFRAGGGEGMGVELVGWGRLAGGHA